MAIDRIARPMPLGFPACAGCWYRQVWEPVTCLRCFEQSARPAAGWVCAACNQRPSGPSCRNELCHRADRAFSVAVAIGPYEGPLRRALLAYKYRDQQWWAGVFARLLAGMLEREQPWFEEFAVLVAVPSFTGSGSRRTWSPVGRIVAVLAQRLTGWEVHEQAVVKRAETAPLTGRDGFARLTAAETSLRGALHVVDPRVVEGRRVLVVDDVLTQGATLREVARALRAAGAREVAGLVIGRSVEEDRPPVA